ncbi:MAG: HAD-IIB family hydrolase [Deltaproteobacteria bacterium]|nr:HAD-IIB family hydrolase [Deltaproteobacteria bacterium]
MKSANGLYVQLFSIHGLLRSENLELGHDADTGGQIKYVVELAKALEKREDVRKVELFTRLVGDKSVSEDYAQPIEKISEKCRIVRIQCGGRKYRRKELLWPYLDEYVDKSIKHIKRQEEIPDVVHGHYPDAGYVALQLSEIFGLPLIYTGHSLGRSKLSRLLNEGMSEKEIDIKFKIDHRIHTEEEILRKADLVITSTTQEIEGQYGLYQNKRLPRFKVLPPGLDIDKFYPYYHNSLPEYEKKEEELYAQASILEELNRFFKHPDKPLVLSLCRPDKRKNIAGLIKAFGEDLELQSMANLAVFAGIRKDIYAMQDNERDVLTEMLLLMDKYDLYGKMAIPKRHDFEYEVPELYRIAAENRGVFVNPALTEPFGITLIEAAACGLPIIAPDDGGPMDIVNNCECGVLVDTTNTREIANAAKRIIAGNECWKDYSKAGVMNIREHYTWESHAAKYMEALNETLDSFESTHMDVAVPSDPIGRRLAKLDYFLITDIDNTLIGDDNPHLEELLQLLKRHREHVGFGVATGRTVDSACDYLKRFGVQTPDVIISSVGAEIYYGKHRQFGKGWETHISAKWDREKIVSLLKDFPFLTYQEEDTQRQFKISYNMVPGKDRLAKVHDRLIANKCRYNLIYSHDAYLDILPYRASKGKALRYVSYKWEIPLSHFLVCGDSGNDEEMLRGEPKAIVVGNFSPELEKLKKSRNVYYADRPAAGGILEGIAWYKFIEKIHHTVA